MTIFRRVADSSGDAGTEGRGAVVAAQFGATEAVVLRQLAWEIMALLGSEAGEGSEDAGDAAGNEDATGSGRTSGGAGSADGAGSGAGPAAGGGAGAAGGPWAGAAGGGDADVLGDLERTLGLGGEIGPPEDPALARLLPDAYGDDPEAAREFRRYTEKDLRARKAAAANTVLATLREQGGMVRLSADEAEAWLRSLNDMRLALGVRLGITDEMAEKLPKIDPDDPRYAAFAVYDWLTEIQESLVLAMQ